MLSQSNGASQLTKRMQNFAGLMLLQEANFQARSTFSSAQSQSKGSFNENEAYTMVSKCGSEFIAVMIFVLVGEFSQSA